MAKGSRSCGLDSHKDQHAIQDAEIKEMLKHIKQYAHVDLH